MLDQWRPGPIWLIDRASVNPPRLPLESLAVYLDQDRDASFSFQEIDALTSRFDRIDLDRDRIITQEEMDSAANQIYKNNPFPAPRFDWKLAWNVDALDSKTPSTSSPRAKFIVNANMHCHRRPIVFGLRRFRKTDSFPTSRIDHVDRCHHSNDRNLMRLLRFNTFRKRSRSNFHCRHGIAQSDLEPDRHQW